MEGHVKKTKYTPSTEHKLRLYFKDDLDWSLLESILTCQHTYALAQRPIQFWYDATPTKRMTFDTIEKLRAIVIQKPPTQIYMSCLWPVKHDQSVYMKHLVHRELILDLDMNDYASVRIICECGEKRQCCDVCWQVYVNDVALPLMKRVLQQFCGFCKVRYVYSGRRGLHVIISDKRVMSWTTEERGQFKQCILDGYGNAKLYLEVHQNIIWPIFKRHFWNVQRSNERITAVLTFMRKTLPDDRLESFGDQQMIGEMMMYIERELNDTPKYRTWSYGVAHFCVGPRFDPCFFTSDVTHMLKCPMSVHRMTLQVCCILNPDEDTNFLPSQAKTI